MGRLGSLAGFAVGLTFLWLALRKADLVLALASLRQADPAWCLAVFGAGLLFMLIKTWRWGWLLKPVAEPQFQVMQRAIYVGSAANMVIPHVGEVLRSSLLARNSTVPAGTALGSIAVERILDMAAVLLISIPVLLFDGRAPAAVWQVAMAALAIAALGCAAVLDLLTPDGRLRRLAGGLAGLLPARMTARVAHQGQRLIEGLGTLAGRRRLPAALGLSVLQWSCVVFAIWASAQAVDLPASLSAAVAVFVLGVVGLTLPSAPATLGTTQLAFVIGMAMAGAPATAALAASFVYTACFIVSLMVIGGVWWTAGRSHQD